MSPKHAHTQSQFWAVKTNLCYSFRLELVSRCRPFTSIVIVMGRKGSGVSPIGNSYPFSPDSEWGGG